MAGAHIALCRVLRLKNALRATINMPEFIALRQFKEEISILQSEDFWNYLFSMCRALHAPMRLLRLADQKVAAMDKMHFYVCQTDANMSHYLTKVVSDAGKCTHDETLRLMNACLQDVDEANNGVNNNDDEEDDKESSVEDDSDNKILSNGEECGEDGSDDDDDLPAAFMNDQLEQVADSYSTYLLLVYCTLFACAN
jgi:hypothetical protein